MDKWDIRKLLNTIVDVWDGNGISFQDGAFYTADEARRALNMLLSQTQHIIKCVDMHGSMQEALKEISEGKGAYSTNPLEHASNCIEEMKVIAKKALK